jgi:hypothetical protein
VLWFEPFAEVAIAMKAFADLLPRREESRFPWYLIKIQSSSDILFPSDDLSIEAATGHELTVRVVSRTIWYRKDNNSPDRIRTLLYADFDEVLQFWRKVLGGTTETNVRWQHGLQPILFDHNLAVLESSKKHPILILTMRDFTFRIPGWPDPIQLEFTDSDTVGHVIRQLSEMLNIRIGKVNGHYRATFGRLLSRGLQQFEPDDRMSAIDHSKEIQVSIRYYVEVKVFRGDGKERLYRLPVQAKFSDLYAKIHLTESQPGIEFQFVDAYSPIPLNSSILSCDDWVSLIGQGVGMQVSVSVEGKNRKFTLREDDRVLNLIQVLSGGSWYLKCNDKLITNNFIFLCRFFFHNPPGHLSASRVPPSGVLIPFTVEDVKFQRLFYRRRVKMASLIRVVCNHFSSSGTLQCLQIDSLILSNPQQKIDLSPSREVRIRFDAPVLQSIRLFFVSKLKYKTIQLPLTATVGDLTRQIGHNCRFASVQEWTFDDPQRLISSYPLTLWDIEVWPSQIDAESRYTTGNRIGNLIPPYPDRPGGWSNKVDSPVQRQARSVVPSIPLHPLVPSSEGITDADVSADCERRISRNRIIPSVIVRPVAETAGMIAKDDIPAKDICGGAKPIRCALILPPDDRLINQEFNSDATVADAITMARQHLSDASVLRICDSDSVILSPETLLRSVAEPRDLFVKKCVVCEIGQRMGEDFSRWEEEVFEDSTVGEMLVLIEKRLGRCKLANDSGQILSSDMKIEDSNHFFVAVLPGSECVIDFHLLNFKQNGLETDGEATVGRFVDYQCDILGVRERIHCVSDNRGSVNFETKLNTVRGVLRCHFDGDVGPDSSDRLNLNPDGLQDLNPKLPELLSVSTAPPFPISGSGGSAGSVPVSDCPTYLFQYEDDDFNLPIPAAWTVFQTKEKVAIRYHTIADYVSLLFCGRNLKDETLLIHQQIGNKKIIVCVRRFNAILLESIGYGSRRGAEKPSDFIERVTVLESDTGQDRLTCSRCLIFYDYDVSRARDALGMIEPS